MKKRALLGLMLSTLLIHSVSNAGGWITSGVRAAAPPLMGPPGPLHYDCEMVASSANGREVYTLNEEFTPERFDRGGVTFRAPAGPESFLAGQALTLRVMRNPMTNQDTVDLSVEAVHQGRSILESSVTSVSAPREQLFVSANVQWRSVAKGGKATSRRDSVSLTVTCRDLDRGAMAH